MEPWYKVATLRKEVREGRSFNPDEFAIALEQVVAGTAPEDYCKPEQFFARTCFTRALREHAGMVLRRLSGRTDNTAPVLTLITQFGGGKTHTLTTLYHLANSGEKATEMSGVADLAREAGIVAVPFAKVAVFVGNAWDPQPGRETPWIDLARQLAGEAGVQALGVSAKTTPPGTESIGRVFAAAGAPVLLLFDEVLNYMNRHRDGAESFHAFIQNLTVATTGTSHGACVISLPRSQVEMTDWDQEWQDKISKVVRRVAKDLIANDEAEIGEVVRRRLFQDLGSDKVRRNIAKTYADWCFERRAQLPPEWTSVDSASTEAKAREFLQRRFESCYPFHPATLSVFQRKWQSLPQYQQTRGTLAMLAQWISLAAQDAFIKARTEPLITLGSAPLLESGFRSVVLGQLGEPRLGAAIETDIAGEQPHSKALDADTKGPLRDIHRRVGAAILFESSGGQSDKLAHLPELRFALGEPDLDTTSIDNAAFALEERSYFLRRLGTDGLRVGYQPTMKKVVSDRRASLDYETEVKPAIRKLVEDEFRRGASISVIPFPRDGGEIPDTPRLTLVVVDPELEWSSTGALRTLIADWTKNRGASQRLYPGALVWCIKKPGRDLRERVEVELAWKRVAREVADGTLGGEFDRKDHADLQTKVRDAAEASKDEVWGDYRYAVVADSQEPDGLKEIDLGAGHSSSGETMCGRVLAALKSEALLNESVGAGYIERNWPPALKTDGAWPLAGLRQSFLNGALTRLIDPDAVLRAKVVEFVARGDFGLASGGKPDGTYERVWFTEPVAADEVSFEQGVYLLRKSAAERLKSGPAPEPIPVPPTPDSPSPAPGPGPAPFPDPAPAPSTRLVRLSGTIPAESWNRLGTRILPKLRSGTDVKIAINCEVKVAAEVAPSLQADLSQILLELGLRASVTSE
ncbi:MAG: ATP-binding protein [Candidatus Eisenbacteria bacterium]|uniref:ATP-binding protein n=1 Tax=Eiseniibacteriota bacterium TaxID=2212470 RepID=A0A933W263_UNCEI|nr:ATP-binding protein [Candidatus Eisenbacteria bacterium]